MGFILALDGHSYSYLLIVAVAGNRSHTMKLHKPHSPLIVPWYEVLGFIGPSSQQKLSFICMATDLSLINHWRLVKPGQFVRIIEANSYQHFIVLAQYAVFTEYQKKGSTCSNYSRNRFAATAQND